MEDGEAAIARERAALRRLSESYGSERALGMLVLGVSLQMVGQLQQSYETLYRNMENVKGTRACGWDGLGESRFRLMDGRRSRFPDDYILFEPFRVMISWARSLIVAGIDTRSHPSGE